MPVPTRLAASALTLAATLLAACGGSSNASSACGNAASCAPGCTSSSECPAQHACNRTTGACETACGDAAHDLCQAGCCSAGVCVDGTSASACGVSGLQCENCAAGQNRACIHASGGAGCGCASSADCTAGHACSFLTGGCEPSCGGMESDLCQGGCCSGGWCVPGTAADACGAGGGSCAVCPVTYPTCNPVAGGGVCG